MNPSQWCNPPPPGTDLLDEESKQSVTSTSTKSFSGSIIDQIDPFIKNPEYLKYKKRERSGSRHRRSRSYSNDRYDVYYRSHSREKKHRRRSRSRSRTKNKHSRRSRSRGRRHRKYSRSSSKSRSPSYERSRRGRKHSRRHRSRSRSRSRNRRYRKSDYKRRSNTPENQNDSFVEPGVEEEEDETEVKENAFKNDGSFLEMFKKMQEEKAKAEAEKTENPIAIAAGSGNEVKKALPAFGKRRGGRVLKTGMVEKVKTNEEDEDTNSAQDPWTIYLKEVKRYKEACCDDDSKTRPLVK